jgi:imidazolonepropionase-like amidohydrolase
VIFPEPAAVPVAKKLAEAWSVPVVITSDDPVMFWATPQLITAAFAGSTANESASAVTVTAAKMLKDFFVIENSLLRGRRNETGRRTQ